MVKRIRIGTAIGAFLGGILGLKLAVLLQLRDHPLLHPDAGLDTTAYVGLAREVLGGNIGLGPGLYYVSPLYIYFLAGALAVFDSFTAVRVLQIALGTAAVACIFLTAREWFGDRAAWIAAGAAALTGLFTFYEVLILQSSIDAFLTAAALLALTLGLRRRTGWMAAAGLIFGIASLNRPNMLLAAAGVGATLVVMKRARPAALLAAGLLTALAPVAIRNAVVARQWSLVSSHGGLNFYIGNGEGATGFYRNIPGISPTIGGQQHDARRVAEAAAGRPLTDAEVSDHFYALAWKRIREQPAAAIALVARKLAYVFRAAHVALPHSYPFYAYDERTLLRVLFVGPWLLVPLGLAGLIFGAPAAGRSAYIAWAAFVPAYAISVAAFFIAERYRLPLLVPLCVGTGAAIDKMVRRPALSGPATAGAKSPGLRTIVIASALLAVFVNWPTTLHDGRWEEGLRTAQRLIILGRYDEADEYVRRFEPRGPHRGATHFGAGAQLLLQNQPERALAHLKAAHELAPTRRDIEAAFADALLKSRLDAAAALVDAGNYRAALAAIRALPSPRDDDYESWLRIGRLAARARVPELAEPYFRQAVQMRPDQAAARQQLGLNLLVLKRFDEAARELAEAVRLDPRDPDSLAHLAYCELQLGRAADARTHADAALAIEPGHQLARQVRALIR
jgi:4-amino-4-deoxy-L-arabinose transferase-like glycosyltransferase/Flp pilus assembly protein TadD